MDFQTALKALQDADAAGHQLDALKAQKSLLISFMSNPELEARDIAQLMSAMSRVTDAIIKQEGLKRDLSDEEHDDLAHENALRKLLGKGGTGL